MKEDLQVAYLNAYIFGEISKHRLFVICCLLNRFLCSCIKSNGKFNILNNSSIRFKRFSFVKFYNIENIMTRTENNCTIKASRDPVIFFFKLQVVVNTGVCMQPVKIYKEFH